MTKPTLAVWMPNFNHARSIGRAIEAIAAQSHLPDACYVIDDASTDNSLAVIKKYQRLYPWLHVIENRKNQGVMALMQQALEIVKTDYVVMAAADDYILPGFFANALALAARYPQAGVIFGQMKVVDDTGRQLYVGKPSRWNHSLYASPQQYLQEYLEVESPNHSVSAASMYRMAALRQVGGFKPELGAWCDTFALQAIGLRYGVCYLVQPVSVWVVNTASVSQGIRRQPHIMSAVIKKAAALMRSPQFAPYFPESYVRLWQRRYRLTLFVQYLISHLQWLPLKRLPTSPAAQKLYRLALDLVLPSSHVKGYHS